jgi:hypothetical protein
MKWKSLLVASALALSTVAAHAQAGLYFNPIVSRISISTPDTGPFAFLGQNKTSRIFGGVMLGGYYEFSHQPKFDVGIDLRDEIEHGNNASLNSFLIGVRIVSQPLAFGAKPYLQIMGGSGRSNSPLSPVHVTKAEYGAFLGVDKRLNRHVDWRILELGYSSVTTISSAIYDGPTPIPAAKMINASTGFVFRIP